MRISDWSSDVCSSDLQAILAMAELEGQQAAKRPRAGQQGRGWRAGIEQQQRAFGHRPLETAERRRGERLATGFRQLEREVELGGILFGAAVEQRQPAVAMAEKTQHRCHAVEIGLQKRSEEHTSELQSLMRISYAVFCLKKKKRKDN